MLQSELPLAEEDFVVMSKLCSSSNFNSFKDKHSLSYAFQMSNISSKIF